MMSSIGFGPTRNGKAAIPTRNERRELQRLPGGSQMETAAASSAAQTRPHRIP